MEETKNTEDPAQLSASEQPVPPKKNETVEDARQIVERMEKANAESKQLLERQEALEAERVISGKSTAGQIPEPEKEETDKEYAERMVAGETKDGEFK